MNSPVPQDLPPQPRAETNDERAVRTLFQNLLDAWTSGDAEAYADLFTEDADYVAFDGVNQQGKGAIIAAHRPLFEKWLKGSRLTGHLTHVRFLSPEVAFLHASGGTILRGKTEPEAGRASVQSLVAVKEGSLWKFTSFHNTRVRPLEGLRGILVWNITDKLWQLFGPGKGQRRLEPHAHPTNRRDPVV